MAWDTERTRRLLLEAATSEFSQHGLTGARVDRIAKRAGVNKERIYQYFGNKEDLFGHVLAVQLAHVIDAVPLTGLGVSAVADYAGRVFDYQAEHPDLARLQVWEALQLDKPANAPVRHGAERQKVTALQKSLPGIDKHDAEELLLTIITLNIGWRTLHTLDQLVTGRDPSNRRRHLARRAAVVATVTAVAEQLTDAVSDRTGADPRGGACTSSNRRKP
jgi:AcrR family transcriptional regulator